MFDGVKACRFCRMGLNAIKKSLSAQCEKRGAYGTLTDMKDTTDSMKSDDDLIAVVFGCDQQPIFFRMDFSKGTNT